MSSRVGSGGEHLAFHQENDLIVVFDGSDFLRDGDQSDAGILFVDVPQNGALGGGIDAGGEIVKQAAPWDSAPGRGRA